ncbi:MAG: hypothetical protein U0235_32320 [Polyangiaceae bacterium]
MTPGTFMPPVAFSTSASIAFEACSRPLLMAAHAVERELDALGLEEVGVDLDLHDLAAEGDGRFDLVTTAVDTSSLSLTALDLALHARGWHISSFIPPRNCMAQV